MEAFTAGGSVSLAALHKRQQAAYKLLTDCLGNDYLAQKVLTDRSYLQLVLPVLDTDGKDELARANLRDAVFGKRPNPLSPRFAVNVLSG